MMRAASRDIPSFFERIGAITILVAPQWIRAHPSCMSPLLSCICTSSMICAKYSISVPYRYWLNILSLGLCRMTLDCIEIGWSWTSFRVTITICIHTYPFPAPSRRTSPAGLNTVRGTQVFCSLSIEGSFVLDLLIVASVISIFACAISGGESIFKVPLGVFWALESFSIITTL